MKIKRRQQQRERKFEDHAECSKIHEMSRLARQTASRGKIEDLNAGTGEGLIEN